MAIPSFWYRKPPTLISLLLAPLGPVWLIGTWLRRRFVWTYTSQLPVVCIGNITTGGTGKTPLVSELAEIARQRGFTPVVLTRGYGGTLDGPVQVTAKMSPRETGDEAAMLARDFPVVIADDRAKGAGFIEEHDLGDLILMDDGMQQNRLARDRQIAVFNGRLGLGNGLPVPAGPLRETLGGLARTDGVVFTGKDRTGLAKRIRKRFPKLPVFQVDRRLNKTDIKALSKRPVVAFAGIGDPGGFFDMLEDEGVNIAAYVPLGDHEPLTGARMAQLRSLARQHRALLVTTEKDAARLDWQADREAVRAVRLATPLDAKLVDLVLPPRGEKKG